MSMLSVAFPTQVAALHRLIADERVDVDEIARAIESCSPFRCPRPCPQCPVARLALAAMTGETEAAAPGAAPAADRPGLRVVRSGTDPRPLG